MLMHFEIIWISYFLFCLLNILKPDLLTSISYCFWTASHCSSEFVLFWKNWASWIGNVCKMEFWDILKIFSFFMPLHVRFASNLAKSAKSPFTSLFVDNFFQMHICATLLLGWSQHCFLCFFDTHIYFCPKNYFAQISTFSKLWRQTRKEGLKKRKLFF